MTFPLPGQLYRVHVHVPESHTRRVRSVFGERGQKALLADVRARLTKLGFQPPLLTTQDPTRIDHFTALARGTGRLRKTDGVASVRSFERVEEPPRAVVGALPLDHGLRPDEAEIVNHALLRERNPRHLGGLASTLEPWFPASASLLRAKAEQIERRVAMTPERTKALLMQVFKMPLAEGLAEARAAFEADVARLKLPFGVVREQMKQAVTKRVLGEAGTFVTPSVRRFAEKVVQDIPGLRDIRVVTPQAAAVAFPPHEEDGFVSPSALQLALALQKPEWSGVREQGRIPKAVAEIQNPKVSVQGLKARSQLERATKAIDRRRWIEWYRRRME